MAFTSRGDSIRVNGRLSIEATIAAPMDLHLAEHRVRDLADHQALECPGGGVEDDHGQHAQSDEGRGEERTPPVSGEVPDGDREQCGHAAVPAV
jgi:hypothetical protein